MTTIVKAAAVQISPVLYSRQGTVVRAVEVLSQQPLHRPAVSSHRRGDTARHPEGIHR